MKAKVKPWKRDFYLTQIQCYKIVQQSQPAIVSVACVFYDDVKFDVQNNEVKIKISSCYWGTLYKTDTHEQRSCPKLWSKVI